MPGDALSLEKSDGIANGDSGSRGVAGWRGRLRERKRHASQPQALDQADRSARIKSQHRRTALPLDDRMAEQEDVGCRAGLVQQRGFIRQHGSRRRIFALRLKTVRVLKPSRMQRKSKYGLPSNSRLGRQWDKINGVVAGKRIRRRAQNRHIVLRILGDDGDFQEAGGSVRAVHENISLAAVAKVFHYVGDCEEIALVVNKESVAEER